MLVALTAVSCDDIDALRDRLEPATPHERYAESLRNAGLDSTALGQDWLLASRRALGEATPVTLPLREEDAFPADSATALGYRFELRRGQRLRVAVTVDTTRPMLLFMDLFMAPRDSAEGPRHIADAAPDERSLDVEARRDGSYLLRVQPELLRGGEYTLTVTTEPSLAFPVAGRDGGAIRSYFGAARDAGRRVHHGIDIFAPRGTAVLAVSDGFVRDAGTNTLGGKVVWVWDDRRGHSYYYAHLDSQVVTFGDRVQPGDTLGFVGNTGNARTTSPHLHFGIYAPGEGPVDPLPFVEQPRSRRAAATATAGEPRIDADERGYGNCKGATDEHGNARIKLPRGRAVRARDRVCSCCSSSFSPLAGPVTASESVGVVSVRFRANPWLPLQLPYPRSSAPIRGSPCSCSCRCRAFPCQSVALSVVATRGSGGDEAVQFLIGAFRPHLAREVGRDLLGEKLIRV